MREIEEERIVQIKRLLSDGYSQREVGRETGVSRSTVNRVATGQRPDCAPPRYGEAEEEEEEDEEEEEFSERCGPVGRCQGCGHLVEMPCLVCQARAVREETLRSRRERFSAKNGVRPKQTADGPIAAQTRTARSS